MAKTEGAAGKAAKRRAAPITAARRKAFLDMLAETANIAKAAQAAGVERSALYRLRQSSESFHAAWQSAMDQALDTLEATMLERAANGTEKALFYGGKPCGTVRQYSDALGMFMLRAHRPDIYGAAQGASTNGEKDERDAQADEREAIHARLNRMADRLLAGDGASDTGDEVMAHSATDGSGMVAGSADRGKA